MEELAASVPGPHAKAAEPKPVGPAATVQQTQLQGFGADLQALLETEGASYDEAVALAVE